MSNFERIVDVSPAYDFVRGPNTKYGIHGVELTFIVKGDKGAVQLKFGTDWYLKSVQDRQGARMLSSPYGNLLQPHGYDIGYHSKVPMYDGQEPLTEECPVIGGRCFYDGSSLNADEWIEPFMAGGTEWLWPKLEQYYAFIFDGGKNPDLTPQYRPHPDDAKASPIPQPEGEG